MFTLVVQAIMLSLLFVDIVNKIRVNVKLSGSNLKPQGLTHPVRFRLKIASNRE